MMWFRRWSRRLYCKARMAAYVDGTLDPRLRQQIGRAIDRDPHCYRIYRQQQDTAHDLRLTLGGLGQPSEAHMARMFGSIMAELRTAELQPDSRRVRHPLPFGLAAVALVAMLFIIVIPPHPVVGLETTTAATPQTVVSLDLFVPMQQPLIVTPDGTPEDATPSKLGAAVGRTASPTPVAMQAATIAPAPALVPGESTP